MTRDQLVSAYRIALACVLAVALVMLTGCAMYRGAIAEKGAEASDATLESALWTICNGIPVGAIKRRFKTESERQAYNTLCPPQELP